MSLRAVVCICASLCDSASGVCECACTRVSHHSVLKLSGKTEKFATGKWSSLQAWQSNSHLLKICCRLQDPVVWLTVECNSPLTNRKRGVCRLHPQVHSQVNSLVQLASQTKIKISRCVLRWGFVVFFVGFQQSVVWAASSSLLITSVILHLTCDATRCQQTSRWRLSWDLESHRLNNVRQPSNL